VTAEGVDEDDLRLDLAEPDVEAFELPALAPYDPEPGHDRVRAWVAGSLLGYIGLLIAGGFALFVAGFPLEQIERLFVILFNPIIGMAGTALGYYFATHAARER
jgi:hypothetical protein